MAADNEIPIRKCPHGVLCGPLDDYEIPANEPVKSIYCQQCSGSHEITEKEWGDAEAEWHETREGGLPE
jgi:hypothetical protein